MAHKILTWLLFAGAIFVTMGAISSMPASSGNSAGGAAAGLWIAFALFYLKDRKPQNT